MIELPVEDIRSLVAARDICDRLRYAHLRDGLVGILQETNISLNPMAFDVPASATALGANEMEVMRGLTVPVLTDRTRRWTSTGSRTR